MRKTCSRCGTEKSFSEFPRNGASPDGYYSLCKVCRAVKAKEYRSRPDVLAREQERLKKHHADNRDSRNARRKARYAADPLRELQRNKWYELRDPEFWKAWRRSYYHRNKEMWRGIVAKRRARLLGAEGAYTVADIHRHFTKQGGKCNCCGCDLIRFEVDHMIPLSRGGTNEGRNLQLLCMPCNRSKADKLPDEFAAYRASFGLPQEREGRKQGAQGIRGAVPGVTRTA